MDLYQRFQAVRAATTELIEPLSPEDCALQSMADASPAKWHLAHTTWFFETLVLEPGLPGYKPFDPSYRVLFNSYYNSIGEQYPRLQRGLLSRPGLEEVLAYRRRVDGDLLALLEERSGDSNAGASSSRDSTGIADTIELGINHEQQHQELILTDLKHALSANPTNPVYRSLAPAPAAAAPPLRWLGREGGLHEIGHDGDGFAFDNESPRHRVFLEDFEIASRPATNAEFMEFVTDDGYRRPELWLSDGWARAQASGWGTPLYWRQQDDPRNGNGSWAQQTLSGLRPLVLEEPVCHLSHYEADAYARWAGARLPTEAEWELAAGSPLDGNFVESGLLHPRVSPATSAGPAACYGDVWEWTSSPYVPYPGFRPLRGSLAEYNGKFMSNQLVLRGGSCATPSSHIRRSYRNFFYPDARWQFSGLRLARDAA